MCLHASCRKKEIKAKRKLARMAEEIAAKRQKSDESGMYCLPVYV